MCKKFWIGSLNSLYDIGWKTVKFDDENIEDMRKELRVLSKDFTLVYIDNENFKS